MDSRSSAATYTQTPEGFEFEAPTSGDAGRVLWIVSIPVTLVSLSGAGWITWSATKAFRQKGPFGWLLLSAILPAFAFGIWQSALIYLGRLRIAVRGDELTIFHGIGRWGVTKRRRFSLFVGAREQRTLRKGSPPTFLQLNGFAELDLRYHLFNADRKLLQKAFEAEFLRRGLPPTLPQ
jgi:hypothetical protein